MKKSAIKQALKQIQQQRKDLDKLEGYIQKLSKNKGFGSGMEEVAESKAACQDAAYDLSMDIEERQIDITCCCNS